jgi:hypothetical protein
MNNKLINLAEIDRLAVLDALDSVLLDQREGEDFGFIYSIVDYVANGSEDNKLNIDVNLEVSITRDDLKDGLMGSFTSETLRDLSISDAEWFQLSEEEVQKQVNEAVTAEEFLLSQVADIRCAVFTVLGHQLIGNIMEEHELDIHAVLEETYGEQLALRFNVTYLPQTNEELVLVAKEVASTEAA